MSIDVSICLSIYLSFYLFFYVYISRGKDINITLASQKNMVGIDNPINFHLQKTKTTIKTKQ